MTAAARTTAAAIVEPAKGAAAVASAAAAANVLAVASGLAAASVAAASRAAAARSAWMPVAAAIKDKAAANQPLAAGLTGGNRVVPAAEDVATAQASGVPAEETMTIKPGAAPAGARTEARRPSLLAVCLRMSVGRNPSLGALPPATVQGRRPGRIRNAEPRSRRHFLRPWLPWQQTLPLQRLARCPDRLVL